MMEQTGLTIGLGALTSCHDMDAISISCVQVHITKTRLSHSAAVAKMLPGLRMELHTGARPPQTEANGQVHEST